MRPLGAYETEELIPVLDYLDQQKQQYKLDGNTILVLSVITTASNSPWYARD